MKWNEEKERILGLSLEERRKGYFCGDDYQPISNVLPWSEDCQQKLGDASKTTEKDLGSFELKDLDLSSKISVFVGDITKLEIDAIVNAANNSLLGGGGVDGAIHRAAGKMLLEENRTLDGCEDGEAKISGGYNLPARYVISTVGPRGENTQVLEMAYENCLKLMVEKGLKTIAFPCISTGVYGYPNEEACVNALKTVRRFLEDNHEKVDRVIFCLFLDVDVKLYKKNIPTFFPIKSKL